jgi:prepilin-type N-terminal cleavage/methylation domain-containing protein
MSTLDRSCEHGFTLVEMVIAVAVIGILAAFGSSMFVDVFRTTRMVDASQTSADQARYAMERIAREVREAQYTGGKYTMTLTDTSKITFTDAGGTSVVIDRNGTTLRLTRGTTVATLAINANSFSVSFLTLGNAVTTDPSTVRFVVVSLTVADAVSGQSITQKTRVALRNA